MDSDQPTTPVSKFTVTVPEPVYAALKLKAEELGGFTVPTYVRLLAIAHVDPDAIQSLIDR